MCQFFLSLGFRTAHCAYSQKSLDAAEVIADTPAFTSYPQLDLFYPRSKFIYLDRSIDKWLPSIKRLLMRMKGPLLNNTGGFDPLVSHAYMSAFGPLNQENLNSDRHLAGCYESHRDGVFRYFSNRPDDFLSINIDNI